MIVTLVFSTVLMPLVVIALLWRRSRYPFSGWLSTFVLAAGITGFGFFVAPWGFLGLPLRFLIGALFIFAVVVSLRRPMPEEPAGESIFRSGLKILIGLFFGSVAIGVLQAHSVPPGAVDFRLPLREGRYLVVHGGSTPAANMHARVPPQRYAVDLVKLNALGLRARGIMPDELTRYEIYGEQIVSPCAGEVTAAVDGLPDNAPGTMDEKNIAGNHVILRCRDLNVLLAHMQRGSVIVRPGARVTAGSPLGRVGNSGNTTEPHLHIHAERGGEGVPMTFERDWLVRNETVVPE